MGLVSHPEHARMVVFIDDLDRCLPESAFRLLEGLKIYLGLKNTVFVLGMNQELIVDAILASANIGVLSSESEIGRQAARQKAEAYLEKLCTDIERVPPPPCSISFIEKWLDDGISQKIVAALTINGMRIRCLPPNPRKLKAMANLLNRWKQIMVNEESHAPIQATIIIAYVYQFHSELYQRWHFNPGFFSHIGKWCSGQFVQSKLPSYFSSLTLPELLISQSQSSPSPSYQIESNFPNPYASDVFWIAPLINASRLTEHDVESQKAQIDLLNGSAT